MCQFLAEKKSNLLWTVVIKAYQIQSVLHLFEFTPITSIIKKGILKATTETTGFEKNSELLGLVILPVTVS